MTTKSKNAANCQQVATEHCEDVRDLLQIVKGISDRLRDRAVETGSRGRADWANAGSLGYLADGLCNLLDGSREMMSESEKQAWDRISIEYLP